MTRILTDEQKKKRSEYRKKWRSEHPEEVKLAYEKALEKKRIWRKKYYALNSEKIKEHEKQYYETHKEEIKERTKLRPKMSPEKRHLDYIKNRDKILQRRKIRSQIPEIKERRRLYGKKYLEEHREQLNKYQREYRKNHKELLREWTKEYRQKHLLELRESGSRSQKRNRHKRKEKNAFNASKRRALKRRASGNGISFDQWKLMCDENNGRCSYCRERKPLGMDHVIPLSKGGEHDISNIVPACKLCNSLKNNHSLLMFLYKRNQYDCANSV